MRPAEQRCHEPTDAPAVGLAPTTFLRLNGDTAPERALAERPRVSGIIRSSPSSVNWRPAPATFPPGARMAVLQGNPAAPELFIAFLRLPDGYELPPHTHSADEHITVVTGELRVGFGFSQDDATMVCLRSGGAATARANEAHYVRAKGVTILQINSRGPYELRAVEPANLRSTDER